MSVFMSVSGRQACKEYLLPDRKGCRHCVFLDASYFCLKKDVFLELLNKGRSWEMTGEKDLVVIDDAGECVLNKRTGTGKSVECGKVYLVFTSSGEQLEISVRECGEKLFPLDKYQLVDGMMIGRDRDCHICLQGNKRVSRKHLVFECREDEWYVRNLGKSGYYLNGRYSDQEQKTGFGDCISILEYKIYIFSNWLAIDGPAFPAEGNRAAGAEKGLGINREFGDRGLVTLAADGHNKDRLDGAASSFEEEDGRIKIRRSPRSVEKVDNDPISIDRPPDLEESGRESLFLTAGPLMSMSIPMLGGSLFMLYAMQLEQRKLGLSAYSGLVMTSLTIVFSLFWAVAAGRFKEKQDEKRQRVIKEAYKRYLRDKDESIRRRYDLTRHVLLCRYPSADICMEYSGFSTMLWARNSYHDDFLHHRLGLGQIPFPTRISVPKEEFRSSDSELWHRMKEICEHYRMMPQLPILLHLSDYRQIGLVGESRREIWDLIRILAVQIAAGNCYSEVKAAVFYDMDKDDGTGRLDFFRWLPHLWDQNFRRRYLAGSREEARELAYELSQIFKNRSGNGKVAADGAEDAAQYIPHYILFILEPEYLEGEMLGHYIFEETQQLGLTVLWCVDEREKLPNSCRLIVENTELFQGMYDVTGAFQEKVKIEYDQVNEEKCRCFARRLARMYISEALTGGDIPSEVPFFSLFGVERAEDLDIGERWEKNRTSESMRAVIGLKTGGQAIYLDIHEKYHVNVA